MKTLFFTQQELMFLCHSLIHLEKTEVKYGEKKDFYKAFFDQVPIDWEQSKDGREISLKTSYLKDLNYYTNKGLVDWIDIGGDKDNPYFHILKKLEEI